MAQEGHQVIRSLLGASFFAGPLAFNQQYQRLLRHSGLYNRGSPSMECRDAFMRLRLEDLSIRLGVQVTRVGMTVHDQNQWVLRWSPRATAFHRVSLHTANSPRALPILKFATAARADEVIPARDGDR